jgi:hypothetical protein
MSALEWVIDQIESTADWRRRKAEEWPDDSRNTDAVKWLNELAEEVHKLAGTPLAARLEALNKLLNADDLSSVVEWLSESLRRVGFSTAYGGVGLIEELADVMEEEGVAPEEDLE